MFTNWPESVKYFWTCPFHQLLKKGLGTDIMNISTWSKFDNLLNLIFPQFLQDVNILLTCSLFLSRLMHWGSTMITMVFYHGILSFYYHGVLSFATSGIGEMIMKEESGTLLENLFKESPKGKARVFLYLAWC